MAAHMVDQFIFHARRLSNRSKNVAFGSLVFLIVGCFWWFRGVAFGIEGPAVDHWGLRWRKVSILSTFVDSRLTTMPTELEHLLVNPVGSLSFLKDFL